MALFWCRWIKQHQLNKIGLRVLDLENLGYQDDPWVVASCVAQVFYMPDPQSNLPPKKKTKHVVASKKQHIIGVDGMVDVEAYNNYDVILLFIYFPKKISVVEKNLPKDIAMGTKMCQGESRYSGLASCWTWSVCVSVCVCKTSFMHACETIYLCMCVRLYIYVCVWDYIYACVWDYPLQHPDEPIATSTLLLLKQL